MILAWQITRIKVLTRNEKRVPDLKPLLSKRAGQKQTVAEQRHVLQALSARYGIPLQERVH